MQSILANPIVRDVLAELKTNARARWLLIVGGVIIAFVVLVQVQGAINSVQNSLIKRTQLLARLEATAKNTEWINRRKAVDALRNEFESRLWPWETDGLASAEFQDWISKLARESGVNISEIRPDIELKASGNLGVRKMSANVIGAYDVNAMEKFLGALAVQNRVVMVDRLRLSSTPIGRYEITLVTYLRTKDARPEPGAPAGATVPAR